LRDAVIADVLGGFDQGFKILRDIDSGWAYMRFLQSKNDAEMIHFGWSWARVFDIYDSDLSFLDD